MASKKKQALVSAPETAPTHKRSPRNELPARVHGRAISFKAWFTNRLSQDKRLKEHHFDQIRLFLKGLGIPEMAEEDQYEEALRYYFGG